MRFYNRLPLCLAFVLPSACSALGVEPNDPVRGVSAAIRANDGGPNGGQDETAEGIDVNDVSLLLVPPSIRPDRSAVLAATTRVGSDDLVPAALFAEVIAFLSSRAAVPVYEFDAMGELTATRNALGPGLNAVINPQLRIPGTPRGFLPYVDLTDRASWSLVSVRLDPCSPLSVATGSSCRPQIRLVLQVFPDDVAPNRPANQALHLIYELLDLGAQPEANVLAAQKRVGGIALDFRNASLALGVSTAGQPLGVHPTFRASPAIHAQFQNEVVSILKRELPSARLNEIAFAGEKTESRVEWSFFSGLVRNGAYRPLAQNFGSAPVSKETRFVSATEADRAPVPVSPRFPGSRLQAIDLFDADEFARPTSPPTSTSPRVTRRIDAASFFNNPQRSAGNLSNSLEESSVSCVACHSGTSALARSEFPPPQFDAAVAASPYRFDDVAARTGATNVISPESFSRSNSNFRSFGFKDGPTVTLRALHETMLVVGVLNPLLELRSVGRTCDSVRYSACALKYEARPAQCYSEICGSL